MMNDLDEQISVTVTIVIDNDNAKSILRHAQLYRKTRTRKRIRRIPAYLSKTTTSFNDECIH